jgi:glycosyltransferase involved in cell wall biosynthesis
MPKVSVLMPVYNGEKYIAEAIDSIVSQTFIDWELIIGDDGSTDNTEEIVRTYSDERIRYYKNEVNKGHTCTKYSLLDKSSGAYIAFLDADDVSLPKRLELQVAFLDNNDSYGLCGTWGVMIDPQGREIGGIRYVKDNEEIRCGLIFSTVFLQSSLMVRRELFREYYYDPEIPLVEDYNFECLLAKTCKLANISEKLVKYRWHESNISHTKKEQLAALSKTIFKRELVNLATYADEDELDIHLALRDKNAQKMSNGNFLDEAWDWLEKLGGANQLCRTYNHYIFCATICFRWMYACKERKAYFRILPFPVSVNFKVLKLLLRQIRLKL